MKRRVKRTVLDLKNIFRSPLDGIGDGVTVRRACRESTQNQQVQRALNHVAVQWRCAPLGHDGDYTQVDVLWEGEFFRTESITTTRVFSVGRKRQPETGD